MILLQTIALLCQVGTGTLELHLNCQKYYINCVEKKYDEYILRVYAEKRLPTDNFYDTFLKQCLKEKGV